jgi:photosystem II stability/assembly factor-like uncharacterized protein
MSRSLTRVAVAITLLLAAVPASLAADAPTVAESMLQALEWRSIGPFRGGRVTAVAGVPGRPLVYYFGSTGGGVWKTTDAGNSWQPLTDGQVGTGSVGAVAVAPSDPNVVYVGMGSACPRGNVSHGDGVYRSTDAGKTWKKLGLADTRHVSRIRVHPTNPDLVWVAALGHLFGPNAERGVFRSADGGATWKRVLFVDEHTGAADLAIDPTNPRVLFAGMWQVRREPWTFSSGGPGSGLYRSTDGGETWTRLEGKGLPKGPLGRIGVTVSPADPRRVWAAIEAEEGGIFRSDDGGTSWKRVNDERTLRQRAWYYTHVVADPGSADVVYALNVRLFRSTDGGATFKAIRVPHGDNHDLWIAPEDPERMIEGNDGGACVSLDGGTSWSTLDNQPTAEFYHVIADDRFPYRVLGAQQDNSTVSIASRTAGAGIGRSDWYPVAGCESGCLAPVPGRPEIVYGGCYGGSVGRLDTATGEERDVTVWPDNPMGAGAEAMRWRFQWTFPIIASRHRPGVVYAAGNVVFRTEDEGSSWQPISPDLTRNDPTKIGPSGGPITKDNTSVEYYGTVFALAESPRDGNVLWAGSDDGLVHVSRDGGARWANVTPKGLPEWSLISQIDASPHDPGTAFIAANRYKLDDFRPYVFVTRDFGANWERIDASLPSDGFVRVVRQDPVRPELLFAGTETGVHVSFDGGARWQPLQRNLPATPVTDLVIKDADVVISTQGRSFWILDDIAPLRQLAAAPAPAGVRLFAPSPASRFGGPSRPRPGVGANPPQGALVYYALPAAPKDGEEVRLEFLDESGAVLRSFSSKDEEKKPGAPSGDEESGGPAPAKLLAKAGLNRFAWDLRLPDAERFDGIILWGGELAGPRVPPGRYRARLTAAGTTVEQPFEVRGDPRLATTADDYRQQYELLLAIRDTLSRTHEGITRLRQVRDDVRAADERAKGTPAEQEIAEAAKVLEAKLTGIEEALYQTKNRAPQDPLNYPIRLNNKLAALAGTVASAEAAPTTQARAVCAELTGKINAQLAALGVVLADDIRAFNQLVREREVPAVVVREP